MFTTVKWSLALLAVCMCGAAPALAEESSAAAPDVQEILNGYQAEAVLVEQRAAELKGLPPLSIDKLYVITEDAKLRDGQMVLFIGLRGNCVKTVFGLPTKLYRELAGKSGDV